MSFLFFSYTDWIQISLLLNGPSTNHWVRSMTIVAFKMPYKFEVYIIPASMLGWVNSHKVLQLDLSTWPLPSGSLRTQPRQPHMMRSSFKNGRWNLGDEIAGKRINHWIWATVAICSLSLAKATFWKGAFMSTWDGLLEDFKTFQAQLPQGPKRRRGKSLYDDRSVKCVNHKEAVHPLVNHISFWHRQYIFPHWHPSLNLHLLPHPLSSAELLCFETLPFKNPTFLYIRN